MGQGQGAQSPISLATILQAFLMRVEDRWYNQQRVLVDGYTFVRCRFDNCELVTARGTFVFEYCFIGAGTRLFAAEAQKTVKFYNVGSRFPVPETLQPEYHPDGTVSIK